MPLEPHPLDNPLWAALTSRHAGLALAAGAVRRYPAEVAPFAASDHAAPLDPAALAALIAPGEATLWVGGRPAAPAGWRVDDLGSIDQLVCASPQPEPPGPEVVPLDESHRPAVLALTALVYPHYFRPHTMRLGRYFGVFVAGQLAAMIGERMAMPGFRELSAICTHPEHTGQGLARRLIAFVGNDLLARGETPFLHVSPSNRRARDLYLHNGFALRVGIPFWSLTAPG